MARIENEEFEARLRGIMATHVGKGRSISGTAIAEAMGISRAAFSMHLAKARSGIAGFQSGRGGYWLTSAPEGEDRSAAVDINPAPSGAPPKLPVLTSAARVVIHAPGLEINREVPASLAEEIARMVLDPQHRT